MAGRQDRQDENAEAGCCRDDREAMAASPDGQPDPMPALWRHLTTCVSALARPLPAVAVLLLLNLAGLSQLTDRSLAGDPDTGQIVQTIKEDMSARGLLGWFTRDWPLGNGFYRPVVTLSLALDVAIYGDWARGYRLTNWVFATVTAVLIYFWAALLTRCSALGLAAGVIFTLRQIGLLIAIPTTRAALVAIVAFALLLYQWWSEPDRAKRKRSLLCGPLAAVPAYLVVAGVEWQATSCVISWIAARTALLGCLFSVASAACFSAFIATRRSAYGVGMVVLAFVAVGSYEQSVMLFALPAVTLLWLRGPSMKRALWAFAAMLAVVGVYAVVRVTVVGVEPSAYQLMQTNSSTVGVLRAFAWYALPPSRLLGHLVCRVSNGPWTPMDTLTWGFLLLPVAWVFAYWRMIAVAPRHALGLWAFKALLFLPMSFLHVFDHYYYMPEAAGAVLAAVLLWPTAVRSPDGGGK